MRVTILFILLSILCSCGAYRNTAIGVTPNDINGVWVGEYSYDNPELQPVTITLVLKTDSLDQITGNILEPNTFGDPRDPALLSIVSGQMHHDYIALLFTYSGNAGVSHSITNQLKWKSGTKLSGRWKVGHEGTIWIRKVSDLHRSAGLSEKFSGLMSNDKSPNVSDVETMKKGLRELSVKHLTDYEGDKLNIKSKCIIWFGPKTGIQPKRPYICYHSWIPGSHHHVAGVVDEEDYELTSRIFSSMKKFSGVDIEMPEYKGCVMRLEQFDDFIKREGIQLKGNMAHYPIGQYVFVISNENN